MPTVKIPISIPIERMLDPEGFLSRECPNPACLRQFRAHNEGTPNQETYFCPYCAKESSSESWWTQEQLEFQKQLAQKAAGQVVANAMKKAAQRSKGALKFKTGPALLSTATLPEHAEASRLVTPTCHPTAHLKVTEDWRESVHCYACGALVTN